MPQNESTTVFATAFRGMEPDVSRGFDNYITRVSTETVKQIPFGFLVMQDSAQDTGCKQFTSQTGKPIGIVPYAAIYAVQRFLSLLADSDGNIGLLPFTDISIKKRGRLWVAIDEDVGQKDAVRARTTVVSTQGPGVFRKTSNAGDTVVLSKVAGWCGTYTAALGYGLLEYDFTAAFANMTAD